MISSPNASGTVLHSPRHPILIKVSAGIVIASPMLALVSGMSITPAFFALCLILIAAGWNTESLRNVRGVALIAGLLTVWPLLTTLWSITPENSLIASLRVMAIMGTGCLALVAINTAPGLPQRTCIHMAVVLAICAALVLLELLPGGGVLRFFFDQMGLDYQRFADKNINRGLCALVIFVWPAMLALIHIGKHKAAFGLLMLLAFPLFLMHSLSAKIAFFLACLTLAAVWGFPRIVPMILAIAIPIFLLLWPWIFHMLDPYLATPHIYNALPESSQHRTEIWRFVLERVLEKPWLGWGMDTARAIPGGDVIYMPGRVYLPLHAHNSILHILLEQGIVGFVLSISAIALVLKRWKQLCAQNRLQGAFAGATLVSYLAIGFTAFGVWQSWWIATGWLGAIYLKIAANQIRSDA